VYDSADETVVVVIQCNVWYCVYNSADATERQYSVMSSNQGSHELDRTLVDAWEFIKILWSWEYHYLQSDCSYNIQGCITA